MGIERKSEFEKDILGVKVSLAVEGLELTEEEIEVIRKYDKGELTEKEVLKIIKERERRI